MIVSIEFTRVAKRNCCHCTQAADALIKLMSRCRVSPVMPCASDARHGGHPCSSACAVYADRVEASTHTIPDRTAQRPDLPRDSRHLGHDQVRHLLLSTSCSGSSLLTRHLWRLQGSRPVPHPMVQAYPANWCFVCSFIFRVCRSVAACWRRKWASCRPRTLCSRAAS